MSFARWRSHFLDHRKVRNHPVTYTISEACAPRLTAHIGKVFGTFSREKAKTPHTPGEKMDQINNFLRFPSRWKFFLSIATFRLFLNLFLLKLLRLILVMHCWCCLSHPLSQPWPESHLSFFSSSHPLRTLFEILLHNRAIISLSYRITNLRASHGWLSSLHNCVKANKGDRVGKAFFTSSLSGDYQVSSKSHLHEPSSWERDRKRSEYIGLMPSLLFYHFLPCIEMIFRPKTSLYKPPNAEQKRFYSLIAGYKRESSNTNEVCEGKIILRGNLFALFATRSHSQCASFVSRFLSVRRVFRGRNSFPETAQRQWNFNDLQSMHKQQENFVNFVNFSILTFIVVYR